MAHHQLLVVGDIHGQYERLAAFVDSPAYKQAQAEGTPVVFTGDIVDGINARNVDTLRLLIREVATGHIIWVRGNHDKAMYELLVQVMDVVEGRSNALAPRKYQTALMAELSKMPAEAFRQLFEDVTTLYPTLPAFVRVGNTYISHGGWNHRMLTAEGPYTKPVDHWPGVSTAAIDTAQRPDKDIMMGFRLVDAARRGGAAHTFGPPSDHTHPRHLVVGHHAEDSVNGKRVTCIDSGCGKNASNPLTAVRMCAHNGHIIQRHTF